MYLETDLAEFTQRATLVDMLELRRSTLVVRQFHLPFSGSPNPPAQCHYLYYNDCWYAPTVQARIYF